MSFSKFLIIFLITYSLVGQEQLLSIQGKYQGGNILVSNPTQSDGFGYCISKVTVNSDILPATIQNNVFEVDFKLFNLKKGDNVFVVLEHSNGCEPKFLNPEILLPKSTFVCESINCNSAGILNWTTYNENNVLDFIIEQFRWGKWIELGFVTGQGGTKKNNYSIQLNLHSGKNTLRVSQRDNTKNLRSSKSIVVSSSSPKIIKTPSRVKNFIYFKSNGMSAKTKYEVYDAYGNLLKQGYGSEVNCSNLLNGIYHLNFDNTSEKFFKID